MTRRELWTLILVLAALAFVSIVVAFAGGATREVQMSSEQQYDLAVLQKKIDGIPVILTAVGALITILVGAVIMIWNQMRKVSENTQAVASSTEAVRLSTIELTKINEQVVASQVELRRNQDDLKKGVDGLLTAAKKDAATIGHAEGEASARKTAEAEKEIAAARAESAIAVERVKTEAAVALTAVAVGQLPVPAPGAVAPSTEPTLVRVAEAIEGVPKAIEALPKTEKGPAQ